jgi:hypothetical protein
MRCGKPGLPGRYPLGGAVEFSWSQCAQQYASWQVPARSAPAGGLGAYASAPCLISAWG